MDAGRDLDALIAEHVFGWRKVHGPKTDYGGPCESFDVLVPPTIDDPFPHYPPRGSIKPWYWCNNWSTDIRLALPLAERYGIAIIPQSKGDGAYRWLACDVEMVIYRGSEINIVPINDTDISADTVPLAICKAVLLSKLNKE